MVDAAFKKIKTNPQAGEVEAIRWEILVAQKQQQKIYLKKKNQLCHGMQHQIINHQC